MAILMRKLLPCNKEETRGRKPRSAHLKRLVWQYWHDQSSPSAMSTKVTCIRCNNKPKIQLGLIFADTVKKERNKRNIQCYVSTWMLVNMTYRELYMDYLRQNPSETLSFGSFVSLKPYYVTSPSKDELEVCICKDHLKVRWAIQALVQLTKKLKIPIPFDNYQTFFDCIHGQCVPSEESV